MVKDALSDSDHRPALADGLGRESDDELLRSPVGNLTQELAQLLAASIVQNQASKDACWRAHQRRAARASADLVSAAAAQRTIAPAFKDGLFDARPTPSPGPSLRHSLWPRRRSISATTTSRCQFPPLGASPRPRGLTAGFAGKWAARGSGPDHGTDDRRAGGALAELPEVGADCGRPGRAVGSRC